MDTNPIGSTFSQKSDVILSEIMNKHNLVGFDITLLLTRLIMYFSHDRITNEEMTDSIQKDLNIPQQTAAQIAEELKTIIPTMWDKMQAEERERLANKKTEIKPDNGMKEDLEGQEDQSVAEKVVASKPEVPASIEEPAPVAPTRKKERPKKSSVSEITAEEMPEPLPKKPIEEKPKRNGPDEYREQI